MVFKNQYIIESEDVWDSVCRAGASGEAWRIPSTHLLRKKHTRVRRDGYHHEIGNNRTLGHSENVWTSEYYVAIKMLFLAHGTCSGRTPLLYAAVYVCVYVILMLFTSAWCNTASLSLHLKTVFALFSNRKTFLRESLICLEKQDEVVYYDPCESPEELQSLAHSPELHPGENGELRALRQQCQRLEAQRGRISARRARLRNRKVPSASQPPF